MLDLGRKLVQITWELCDEFFSDPHAAEYAEELAKLFHLVWTLQDVELVNMGFS